MHHHSSFLYRWRRGTWTSPDNTPFHNDYKVVDKPPRGFHILRSLDLLGVREVWRGTARGGGVMHCYSPRVLRGRRRGGPPTARADTLVKPEASGATSPSTVCLTLLQTLKLPAGLRLNFRPPTSLYAELWGYTASLTVGRDLSPRLWYGQRWQSHASDGRHRCQHPFT